MLKLRNISLVYPCKTKALDDITLSMHEGESVALIGENGAGKTSLLLAVSGVFAPEQGTIEVDGIQLSKKTLREVRKRIGLVFQNPDDQLFMPLIFDDVAFGCRNFGMAEDALAARVEETLRLLHISHLGRRSSLKLSGGEKRMAAIATVLAMEPRVLMFDEPTAFLDHKARRRVIETLQNLRHTKIVATHDLAFAAEVCDRVVILKEGRVAGDGALALLRDKTVMQNCGLEAIA